MTAEAEQLSISTLVVRPLRSKTRRNTTETTNVSSGRFEPVRSAERDFGHGDSFHCK